MRRPLTRGLFEQQAHALSAFLSGKRLLIIMISIQMAASLLLAVISPPDAVRVVLIGAAFYLVAGLLAAALPSIARAPGYASRLFATERRQAACWVLLCLAAGMLYAAYKSPWPDELEIVKTARLFADEGIVNFFLKYSKLHWAGMQHPPLAGIVYGLTFQLLGYHLYLLRLVSLVMAAVTVYVTYLAGGELFDKPTGAAAAAIFLAMPATFRVGATALVGVTIAGIIAIVLLLVWKMAANGRRPWLPVAAGVVAGVGLLIKYIAGLVFPVLLGWYVALPALRRKKRELALLVLTAMSLLAVWIWIAASTSVLDRQVSTIIDYADAVAASKIGKRMLVRTLLFSLPAAIGVYLLPLFIKGCAVLAAERPRATLPVLIWLGVPLLIVLPTLPDFRYMLPSFSAIAMIAALGWMKESPHIRSRLLWLSFLYCAITLVLLNEVTPTSIVPR